ncbi:MAG: hypothetical protein AAGJ18_00670 [Bacteroidota bacterium]
MFRYEIATDSLIILPLKAKFGDEEDLFRLNSIVDIIEDASDNNILWCAANNGLLKLDRTTLKYERLLSPAKGTTLMTVTSLYMDEPDRLWMGAFGGGVIEVDVPTKKWTYHTYDKPDMSDYDGMGYRDVVESITRKSPTEFWIQTKNRGPGIFHTASKEFYFFVPDNSNPAVAAVD